MIPAGYVPVCRKYQKLMHPDLHFSYPTFGTPKESSIDFIEQWRTAFTENPYLSLDTWRGYLDSGNKQANINILECHQIIKKLSFKPFESVYKVLILWLPEYLDKQGNALLKVIEEPQPNTLFLLVAQNQDQILNTILSRTQLIKIPCLNYEDVKGHLIAQHNQTETAASEIAYLSNGNMTEALGMLQQDAKGYHNLFVQWLRLCFRQQRAGSAELCRSILKNGAGEPKEFFALRYQFHPRMLFNIGRSRKNGTFTRSGTGYGP
jgi:DNA polymerase-3 subunit delta'